MMAKDDLAEIQEGDDDRAAEERSKGHGKDDLIFEIVESIDGFLAETTGVLQAMRKFSVLSATEIPVVMLKDHIVAAVKAFDDLNSLYSKYHEEFIGS